LDRERALKDLDEEKKREEEERKARELKEQKETEEYLKVRVCLSNIHNSNYTIIQLRADFVVESEGYDEMSEQCEQDLLAKFFDYITRMKVVNMDELGGVFGLKTTQAIDRVKVCACVCVYVYNLFRRYSPTVHYKV
jgi:hypothetical protein